MQDSFITIMAIMIALILMFVVPFMATANQNDRITKSNVQTIVDNFTNTVAREGKITESTYRDLIQSLGSTGNTYAVNMEVQVLDQNPNSLKGSSAIGENEHYSDFTSTIVSDIDNKGVYQLHQGDFVIVNVKNTNVTMGTKLKNFLYSIMGKDTIAIEVSSSTMISKNGY